MCTRINTMINNHNLVGEIGYKQLTYKVLGLTNSSASDDFKDGCTIKIQG
jgi:hypothetical protein